MFKKIKVFVLISVCLLIFGISGIGVFAFSNATYVLDGTIEYSIDSALVEVQTRIYSSSTNYTEEQIQEKILEVQNADFDTEFSDLNLVSTSEKYSSIDDETTSVLTKDCDSTFELSYSNNQSTYFFVTNVKNLVSLNNVWAVMQDEISTPESSNMYSNFLRLDNTNQNQPNGQNIVVVLTKKPNTKITDGETFDYGIKIGVGKLGEQDFNLDKLIFTYHSSSSGSYYSVKAKDTTISGTVVIPDFYDNGTHGLLKVSHIDNNAFSNCNQITNVSFSDQITDVNYSAFSNCYNLQSVFAKDMESWCKINFSSNTSNPKYYAKNLFIAGEFINKTINLPETITTMGSFTFTNCYNLENAYMSNSITKVGSGIFYDCINLKNVQLSNQLTNLGSSMFYACENLETIDIPETVTSVGYSCFFDCYELKVCNLPKAATTVGSRIWGGCSSLEEITVTDIPSGSWGEEFENLFGLTNFSGNDYWVPPLKRITFFNITTVSGLPPTLEEINLPSCMVSCEFNNTFWYKNFDDFDENGLGTITACDDPDYKILVKVDPLKVKSELTAEDLQNIKISSYSFSGAVNLKKITLPSTITEIPNYCFRGASGIKEVILPDTVTKINAYSFQNCTNLETVTFSQNLEYIGSYAFDGCSSLDNVILPDSVTSILGCAFYSCSSLKNIILPNNLKTIDYHMFHGCSNLEEINIPNSVTTINWNVFENCINLKSVRLPESLVTFGSHGNDVFVGCANLEYVYVPKNITTLNMSNFVGCKSLKMIEIDTENTAFTSCIDNEQLKYIVNNSTGQLVFAFDSIEGLTEEITTIGDYAFQFYKLNSVSIPSTVTTINSGAFSGNIYLEEIIIPGSITTIQSSAFSNCTNLRKVYIDDLKSYCNINFANTSACPLSYGAQLIIKGETEDTLVTELVVDDSFQNINNYAFYNYQHLVSLTITNSDVTVGTSAFSEAGKIVYVKNTTGNSITVPTNTNQIITTDEAYESPISYVGDYIIYDYVSEDGSTSIKYLMGTINQNLVDVVVPKDVTQIYKRAFYNNSSIKTIALGDSVEIINDYAFYGAQIEELNIPINVDNIRYYAFYNCKKLNRLILQQNSGLTIEDYAFYNCSNILFLKNLTGLSFDSYKIPYNQYRITVTTDEMVDTGITEENGLIVFTRDSKKYLYGVVDKTLTTYTIPEDVNIICQNAFLDCVNLTTITIPNSIEKIEADAFKNCTKLNYVNINDMNNWLLISFANQYATPLCYANTLYVQNQKLTTFIVPEEITELKNYAFYNIESLQSVTLHNSLLKINGYAFSNTGIASIEIPSSVTTYGSYMFAGCSSLSTINLPDNITSISRGMFQNCISLETITIPDSVTSFNSYAFDGCISIKSVNIPESTSTYITAYLFRNCVSLASITIPSNVTSIYEYAFYNCSAKFENLSGLKYVSKYAFYGCKGLTEIDLSNATNLSEYAFANCSNLETVIMPETMTTITRYLFYGCSNLKNINWPTNLVKIDDNAFEYSGLVNVVLPSTVKTIGSSAFEGCYYLESIILPEGLTTLNSNRVFFYCWSLKELIIPESVTSISNTDWLWVKCKNLKRLEINCKIDVLYLEEMINLETLILKYPPSQICIEACLKLDYIKLEEGLTRFSYFRYSDNVKEIDLPSTITYIGSFSDTDIDKLIVRSVTPPDIDDNVYSRMSVGTKIYVPQESVELYKAHEKWSRYKDYIFAIESIED